MEKYKYILFDLIFFLPPILFVIVRYKKLLAKNLGVLFFAGFFGIVGFFIVDPFAVIWGAWGYNYKTTLGVILPGGAVIEEIIWALFVSILLGCFVIVSAEREDKQNKKKNFLKPKSRK